MELNQNLTEVKTGVYFSKFQWLSVGMLLLYFLVRFPMVNYLDQRWAYSSYFFEAIYSGILLFVFWQRVAFKIRLSARLAMDIAAALIAGYVIYKTATPLGLVIPFDLRAVETTILLIAVAPVLEEMIFRMALWELLSELYKRPLFLLLSTSGIFSFSHFFAWWSVPVELHSFVLYQTIYTFGLALYCGIRRIQTKTVTAPILVHLFFNVGFYLGFFL